MMAARISQPNKTDVLIGKNLYETRINKRMSQSKIGEFLGVSYQQVQKYEKGIDHLSMESLHTLSMHLGVSIHYFFTDHDEGKVSVDEGLLEDLLLIYFQIGDPKKRVALVEYGRILAKEYLLEGLHQKS